MAHTRKAGLAPSWPTGGAWRAVACCLCGAFLALTALTAAGQAAAAPAGTIAMMVYCEPHNNAVRLVNNTAQTISIEGWTLGSIYRPGPREPFTLHDPVIDPGSNATFFTGASKDRVLTGDGIFKPDPSEGARLTTPYGTLEVRCVDREGSLPVVAVPGLPATGAGGTAGMSGSIRGVRSPASMGAAAPDPTVTLIPDHGPCGKAITVKGANFPPGYSVLISGPLLHLAPARADKGGGSIERLVVPPSGAFEVTHLPCSSATRDLPPDPTGTLFDIPVEYRATETSNVQVILASFRVEGATLPGLPNTGAGGGRQLPAIWWGVPVALQLVAAAGVLTMWQGWRWRSRRRSRR